MREVCTVKNAYEFEEEYTNDGKCHKRKRIVGPIVVWGLVAIIALFLGQALPSGFWQVLKP
jgi:hypothetical protein